MIKSINGSVMTLTLKEDLIAPNVKNFETSIAGYMLELDSVGMEEMVLDLSNCENIDSIGVTFVVSLYKNVIREGKNFRVSGSNSDIRQLFKLMKLDEFIDLED
jgi:anti-anti-sigma factor